MDTVYTVRRLDVHQRSNRTGGDGNPVVLLQQFRGTLDNWDRALVDEMGGS